MKKLSALLHGEEAPKPSEAPEMSLASKRQSLKGEKVGRRGQKSKRKGRKSSWKRRRMGKKALVTAEEKGLVKSMAQLQAENAKLQQSITQALSKHRRNCGKDGKGASCGKSTVALKKFVGDLEKINKRQEMKLRSSECTILSRPSRFTACL